MGDYLEERDDRDQIYKDLKEYYMTFEGTFINFLIWYELVSVILLTSAYLYILY